MCTLNVKMDDRVVNRMRPLFDGDKAMNRWIETVLHKAMVEYADAAESRNMKEMESRKFLERLEALNPTSSLKFFFEFFEFVNN